MMRFAIGDGSQVNMLNFQSTASHRANQSPRLGVASHDKENYLTMETCTQEELKAHLMASNDGYRQLAEEHASYHAQLEALEAKNHFTPDDEAEEHRLKKIKLRLKDQMTAILSQYKEAHV